jgi:protein phosphatase
MITASGTHIGYRRENNEDSFFVRRFSENACLLAVADGMGGEVGGGLASRMAVGHLESFVEPKTEIHARLTDLVLEIHSQVLARVEERPELQGMGTTLVLAYIKKPFLYWVHVGDSRLYLFRDGNLIRTTEDHTVPGRLLATGDITEEMARAHPMRNLLLRCVGCKRCEPETGSFAIKPTDIILLCSDGLYGEVAPEMMVSVLGRQKPLAEKCQDLIDAALAAGGPDNITVVAGHI